MATAERWISGTVRDRGEETGNGSLLAIPPIERATLSEQVAKRIAAEIEAKRWQPGEKLPSEAALCKAFQVGRSTLREALKSLAFIGLVHVVPGDGSYVSEERFKILEGALLLSHNVFSDEQQINAFCEARILIETELAGLCAERASEEDIHSIQALIAQMVAAQDGDPAEYRDLDLSFHLTIAAAAQSPVLMEMMKHIRTGLEEFITNSIYVHSKRKVAHKNHEDIFAAIQARNGALARKAMRLHLRPFQNYYLELVRARSSSKVLR